MIKIAFQLTRKELLQGMLTIARSRGSVKIAKWIGILFVAASLISLVANFILNAQALWYALGFLAFSLYVAFNLDLIIWFQVKNLVKNKAQITEPMSYTFQESSYEFKGESFSTQMNYSKLHEVLIGPQFILLKISESSAHIVPRRAFSADQLYAFKEIIKSVPHLKITGGD